MMHLQEKVSETCVMINLPAKVLGNLFRKNLTERILKAKVDGNLH